MATFIQSFIKEMGISSSSRLISYLSYGLLVFIVTLGCLLGAWYQAAESLKIDRMDRFGQTIAAQMAALSIEPVMLGDRVGLGVLASRLNAFPEIRGIGVYSIDSQELTQTGLLSKRSSQYQYQHTIDLQDSQAGYVRWVARQGSPRHIITLLASSVSAEQLAILVQTVETSGMVVDAIRRLSGRVPLLPAAGDTSRVSIELSVRGEIQDPLIIKSRLLQIAGNVDFDCSVQRDTLYRRNRRLVAFDMDSTLISQEVIDELAKLAGVGVEVAAITRKAMQGEMDFKESFRQRVALLKGLPESALDQVARQVVFTEGAERLLRTLKTLGYTTAILSGGFQYVAEHIKSKLGIDYVYANQLEIVSGQITGKVEGDIVDAQGKARLLQEICAMEGIDLQQAVAIGDGANDLPMLSVAGLGVAFHAKALVAENADHTISKLGLDCVLYLMGFSDTDVNEAVALSEL